MNVKVQCACGSKYSFDVEPVDGRMPFAVKCPTCGADGTEAANQIIAQSAPPPTAIPTAIPVARLVTPPPRAQVEEPARTDMMEARSRAQEKARRKREKEDRNFKVGSLVITLLIVGIVGSAGFWGWYALFGSKPAIAYSTIFGEGRTAVQYIGPGQFLMVDAQRATLHDLKTDKDRWTTPLSGGAGRRPEIYARDPVLWVCLAGQVVQLDKATGSVKTTIPVDGAIQSFTPTQNGLVVVSALNETTRRVVRINPSTGESSSQDITVPHSEKHDMPDELPPNVQPTAGVLLSQAMDEQKFNKPLDAMSSQFYAAGESLVEMRVKLVEPKVEWVKSIRPKGQSLLNGSTTVSTSAFGVADETFNDIKRSQTGGVKPIDQSHYEVKVRRWTGPQPVEWTGDVNGTPGFFPLQTVDLLTAGKELTVFDKQNQKLFQASLLYPVAERFIDKKADPDARPGIEGPGALYFFDQGTLTALALPSGQALWRLPTVGVTKVQFDAKGDLYVDSTTASPDDIQYSDQITFDKIKPVLLKVDAATGRILWQAAGVGQDSFLSGKFVYATSSNMGGVPIAMALGEALGAPTPDEPTYFSLYRIDPETGKTLWTLNRDGVPQNVSFQDNHFVWVTGRDVQAWGFLSF